MTAMTYKALRIVIRDIERYIEITPEGKGLYHELKQAIEGLGYSAQYARLIQVSHFNSFDEYEKLTEEMWPEAMYSRRQLNKFADIKPGMKVLELGCGTGLLTFEAKIFKR